VISFTLFGADVVVVVATVSEVRLLAVS